VGDGNSAADPEQTEHRSDGSDALWHELRMLCSRADPVPPEVLQAARESFAWTTIEAELAELTYDSAIDGPVAGAVGDVEGPRLLRFQAAELSVELEVTVVGERRRVVGRLLPPQPARVEICHRSGRGLVAVDELGRFDAEDVAAGPSSLRCHLTGRRGAAPLVTNWVLL
jgi:hypothetical protein